MPEANQDRHSMTDHDLLIRIDERVETLQDRCDNIDNRLDSNNKLRPRLIRLEVLVGVLVAAGGGAAAGVNLLG